MIFFSLEMFFSIYDDFINKPEELNATSKKKEKVNISLCRSKVNTCCVVLKRLVDGMK